MTFNYPLNDETKMMFGDPPKCFCCGERADAMWSGREQDVNVCRGCAMDVLPALMADAFFGRVKHTGFGSLSQLYTMWSLSYNSYLKCLASKFNYMAFKNDKVE